MLHGASFIWSVVKISNFTTKVFYLQRFEPLQVVSYLSNKSTGG